MTISQPKKKSTEKLNFLAEFDSRPNCLKMIFDKKVIIYFKFIAITCYFFLTINNKYKKIRYHGGYKFSTHLYS